VISIQETLLGNTFKPVRVSEIITTELAGAIVAAGKARWQKIWHLYDRRQGRYNLYVPDAIGDTYTIYTYLRQDAKKIAGWWKSTGMDFGTGFRDSFDRLYGCFGNQILRIGDDLDPIYDDAGKPIPWVWELPWMDFKSRLDLKQARYIQMETKGDGDFNLSLFTDYIFQDVSGVINFVGEIDEFNIPLLPNMNINFQGGNTPGYGVGTQPFGGGRRTNDPRMFAWTARFKVAKIRLTGSTTEKLGFVSFSIAYQRGSIRR
jgi:hypothetical protein